MKAPALLVDPDVVFAKAKHQAAVFARVASLDGLDVQQIHGDLHLGQTLRTATGVAAARPSSRARLGRTGRTGRS